MTAPFVITRVVDAPRDKVWQAWTEVEHLRHWWQAMLQMGKLDIARLQQAYDQA